MTRTLVWDAVRSGFLHPFLAGDPPYRHSPRRGGPPPVRREESLDDHPVLFMSGLLAAVSAGVIALWQAMGLLLPL